MASLEKMDDAELMRLFHLNSQVLIEDSQQPASDEMQALTKQTAAKESHDGSRAAAVSPDELPQEKMTESLASLTGPQSFTQSLHWRTSRSRAAVTG